MGDRQNELVSVREPEDVVAARLSPFARAQYWWFCRTERLGRSPWTRDLRFVVAASLAALVMLLAVILLLGGTGLVENKEQLPSSGSPKIQPPGPGQ